MKVILLLLLTLAMAPYARARFSKLIILSPAEKDARHSAYHPKIVQHPKSVDFVDVRIPWVDDGKSYWLALASAELSDEALAFRSVIAGAGMPSQILAFTPLTQQGTWIDGRYHKRPGFIEFTLHKSVVEKAYIYHDFANPLTLDGGFYYTVKLGAYPVEHVDVDQPATAVDPNAEGDAKPKP